MPLSAALFAAAHGIGHLSHGLTQVGGGLVLATWAVHAAINVAVVAFLYRAADFIRRSPP